MDTSIKLQKNIKDNSLELQDFISDLHRWEKDIKKNEEKASPTDHNKKSTENLPPVRCRKSEISTDKIITDNNKRRKQENPVKKDRISSYDYAAWDKFDVDKALESESSSSEEEVNPTRETTKPQTTTSASSKGPTSNQKERATKLKDEGNTCYSKGRLEDAIAKYTQGMACDPTNAILPANRAMAYIKLEKYAAAETDCNKCLRLDPNYIKAYLRRGTTRLKLQKLKLAAEDFRKVLELEPWNKDAKKELEKLESGAIESENNLKASSSYQKKDVNNVELHQLKETSHQNVTGKTGPQGTCLDLTPQTEVKNLVNTCSTTGDSQRKKEHGKKLKIIEVDSSKDQPKSSATTDESDRIMPIVKLPHQRSQKPMKRLAVVDVPSEESIPKELSLIVGSKSTKEKDTPKSSAKSKCDDKKPQVKATELAQRVEKPVEQLPPMTLPPVPRTSHQFSQDLQRLIHHHSQAVEYLKSVPVSFFRGLELETEVLVDLISALRWDDFNSEQAVSYLSALAQSDGFSLNIMFLDSNQKKAFLDVIEKCKDQEVSHGDLLTKVKSSLL